MHWPSQTQGRASIERRETSTRLRFHPLQEPRESTLTLPTSILRSLRPAEIWISLRLMRRVAVKRGRTRKENRGGFFDGRAVCGMLLQTPPVYPDHSAI